VDLFSFAALRLCERKKISLAKQERRKEGWINYPLRLCVFARKKIDLAKQERRKEGWIYFLCGSAPSRELNKK
jgi:hypothetical protein